MPRLLFEKTGNAKWISHLDLMRVFQRAFKRAGFRLTHTQGFNPRPSVSIALPLSVGVESFCELLDFDLTENTASNDDIKNKLNHALISGVRVLEVYDCGCKIKDIAFLQCDLALEYDNGVPYKAENLISELLEKQELIVPRRTKNGMQDQNIIPMIRSFKVFVEDENTLRIRCVICCQNPSLNPMQIVAAIGTYLPCAKPSFCKCTRLEVLDASENVFR